MNHITVESVEALEGRQAVIKEKLRRKKISLGHALNLYDANCCGHSGIERLIDEKVAHLRSEIRNLRRKSNELLESIQEADFDGLVSAVVEVAEQGAFEPC